MNVLVINCGSSTLKYQLINTDTEAVLAKGNCERIKVDGVHVHTTTGKEKIKVETPIPDHSTAVKLVLAALTDKDNGAIKSLDEIDAIGHRVVHGGERFATSVVVDDEIFAAIEECSDLAPLHNPANLIGIKACMDAMPGVKNVAVFDTAFHQTMPEEAYMYGIPYSYYENYKIRRYGFHGTSHSFVSKRAIEILGKPVEDSKVIVCHIGGGASICAVKGGKSVDTSMGFTPLDGLIMGTRSGSIDPAIVDYIADKEGKTAKEVVSLLNKQSGVLGISGRSSDFRDIDAGVVEGDKRCKVAFDMTCYQAAKLIGGYVAAMNGVDMIAFTAGIGENDTMVREKILSYLTYLGIELDTEANKCHGEERMISTADSRVKVYAIPTNEELAIARETVALV